MMGWESRIDAERQRRLEAEARFEAEQVKQRKWRRCKLALKLMVMPVALPYAFARLALEYWGWR